jgi:hypothetical protein
VVLEGAWEALGWNRLRYVCMHRDLFMSIATGVAPTGMAAFLNEWGMPSRCLSPHRRYPHDRNDRPHDTTNIVARRSVETLRRRGFKGGLSKMSV